MGVGFGLLGLEPRAFWSMTLKEIAAAVRGRLGVAAYHAAPSRSEMTSLMHRFPDA